MNNFVTVKSFNSRTEAEIAKGFLASNDINSIISADDEGGAGPFPLQVTPKGVQLLVQKKDLRKALKLFRK